MDPPAQRARRHRVFARFRCIVFVLHGRDEGRRARRPTTTALMEYKAAPMSNNRPGIHAAPRACRGAAAVGRDRMGRSRERLGLLLAVSVLAVGAVAVPWFTPGPALAITPVFNGNVLVDDAGSPAGSPRIAVGSDGVIHVVWTDARTGTSHAYYSRSVDDGASWSPSVRVDDAPAAVPAFEPDVAVGPGGSDVYVEYRDLRNGNWDIFAARSPDAGLTWRAGVRVDDAPGSATAHHPVLAVDGSGTVYAVWEDWRNATSQYQIFASASASRGASWSRNVQVSDAAGWVTAAAPAISAAGTGRPVVVWGEEEIVSGQPVDRILYARSPDSGATWARSTIAAGGGGSPP